MHYRNKENANHNGWSVKKNILPNHLKKTKSLCAQSFGYLIPGLLHLISPNNNLFILTIHIFYLIGIFVN